jgi:hypothetical protein
MTRARNTADTQTASGGPVSPSIAGKNAAIINGGMDIWQRGTSFSGISSSTYSADRWISVLAGTSISCTATQDTSVPSANYKYSLKYQQLTTTATSITSYTARQVIEQSNVLALLGKPVTLSFWYRSNKTGSHGFRILETYNTGGTDQATTFTVNAADTWEYKTIAITAFSAVTAASASPTGIGALVDIGFRVNDAGFTTLSANDYFQFTGVQLEVGSVATPFSRAGGTIQGELAACQRYYYRVSSDATQVWAQLGFGSATSTTNALCNLPLKVSLRVVPTSVDYANLVVTPDGLANYPVVSAAALVTSSYMSKDSVAINLTSTGLTQYRPYWVHSYNNSNGYLGLSAEL